MSLSRANLEEGHLQPCLRVPDVGSSHQHCAELLGEDLGAQLAGRRRCEPIIHRVGIVIVSGVKHLKTASFRLQCRHTVEFEESERKLLSLRFVLECLRLVSPRAHEVHRGAQLVSHPLQSPLD